jgi:hypothetical protein
MDDFPFVGPKEVCEQTIILFDIAWNTTGFESSKKKRVAWSHDNPVRWLGQHYKLKADQGRLNKLRSKIFFEPPKMRTSDKLSVQLAS